MVVPAESVMVLPLASIEVLMRGFSVVDAAALLAFFVVHETAYFCEQYY